MISTLSYVLLALAFLLVVIALCVVAAGIIG